MMDLRVHLGMIQCLGSDQTKRLWRLLMAKLTWLELQELIDNTVVDKKRRRCYLRYVHWR